MTVNRNAWIVTIVISILVVGLGVSWWWNRDYGEISPRAYDYAMALFSACNQKKVDKVNEIGVLIEQDAQKGQLASRETRWLQAIITQASNGNWDRANREIRSIMEDQIQPANSLPDLN